MKLLFSLYTLYSRFITGGIHGLLVVLTIFFGACQEDVFIPREYPIISTLPVTNISNSGEITLNCELLDLGENEITSFGFAWSTDPNFNFENAKRYDLGVPAGIGDYSMTLNVGMVAGTKYYIRAYTIDKSFSVLGNDIEFDAVRNSPLHEITSVIPNEGTWSENVTLSVKNYNKEINGEPQVRFGEITADILEYNDTTIQVTVPTLLDSIDSHVKLIINGRNSEGETTFKLNEPIATSFSPDIVGPGGMVTLIGENFHPVSDRNQVLIGNTEGQINSATPTSLIVQVPPIAPGAHTIKVKTIGSDVEFSPNLQFLGPEAGSFLPIEGLPGTEVLLSGANFGTDPSTVEVYFGSFPANVISITESNIWVNVPNIPTGQYILSASIQINTTVFSGLFNVTGPTVDDFTPESGSPNDLLYINGTGFGIDPTLISAFLDNNELEIVDISNTRITVRVPFLSSGDYLVRVILDGKELTAQNSYTLTTDFQTDGLVGYWPFDGHANDLTPNGNNGIVNGAILTEDRHSVVNSAYQFDGINDYLTIPHDQVFNFKANENFTVSLWIKVTDPQLDLSSTVNDIITKWVGSPTGYPFTIRYLNSQSVDPNRIIAMRYSGSSCSETITEAIGNSVVNDDTWHHIVMVKDGSNVVLFQDTFQVAIISDQLSCNTENTFDISIGRRPQEGRYFRGIIDDILIYNRALTTIEIEELHAY